MSELFGIISRGKAAAPELSGTLAPDRVIHRGSAVFGLFHDAGAAFEVAPESITIGMRSAKLPHAHGVEFAFKRDRLVITTDIAEQRRLYWQENGDAIAVATRLDLLQPQPPAIDAASFIGQWCLSMNVSPRPLFDGVRRLHVGHALSIHEDGSIHVSPVPPSVDPPAEPLEALRQCMRDYSQHDIVLGLSGGVDSRTLASVLVNMGIPFRVHTYGSMAMPDVQRAAAVARAAGVEIAITDLSAMQFDVDAVLRSMRRTAWQTEGSYPGAHALVFDDAGKRIGSNALLIDGGYGALHRGGFGNALLWRHRRAVTNRDARVLASALRRRTPALLHEEFRQQAGQILVDLVDQAIMAMPAPTQPRPWIDAFFTRWNPPGFVASPQSVYDARMASVMPFLDARVMHAFASVPAEKRAGGRIFRAALRRTPGIATLPYVGKRSDVPFAAAGRPLPTALVQRFSQPYPPHIHGAIDRIVFAVVRPAMLDAAHSNGADPFQLFNNGAVQHLLQATMPDGDASDIAQLMDWFSMYLMGRKN